MTKIRLTAVAALAALGVAGCGGGDSNKTLSYSDFGKKANEICKDANTKVNAAGKATGNAQTDAPILAKVIVVIKDSSKKFAELKPPTELQADFDTFKSVTEQQISQAEKAEAAAKAGDQAGYIAVIKGSQSLGKQSDAAASKLGAIECTK
jgi:hypothetical protein